jgi:hypothetical protein
MVDTDDQLCLVALHTLPIKVLLQILTFFNRVYLQIGLEKNCPTFFVARNLTFIYVFFDWFTDIASFLHYLKIHSATLCVLVNGQTSI